jgi:hypothetical protein
MTKEKLIKKVEKDIRRIIGSKVPEKEIISQIERFEKGIPFLKLLRPCRVGDGIKTIPKSEFNQLTDLFSNAAREGRIMKFVPASGAASRMFKPLLSLVNSDGDINESTLSAGVAGNCPDNEFAMQFIKSIDRFAFYEEAKTVLSEQGVEMDTLVAKGSYREIFEAVLSSNGLNYASLPKGLIKFHKYPGHPRTPFEEHMVEAIAYCLDRNGNAEIHFTVSSAHRHTIENYLEEVRPLYETGGIHLNISFSFQERSTDTIAVDINDQAFRKENDELLFRPGGHGALIENMNELEGDIIYLKNIDNVVPDRLKPEANHFKRILGGYMVELQLRIFDHLEKLAGDKVDERWLSEAVGFAKGGLFISFPDDFEAYEKPKKISFLFSMLNRPIRISGMVRIQDEPGGGPFWVEHSDKSCSLQIVETSQVDENDPEQLAILRNATHFNPVDIVCGVRDFWGNPFDLKKFVDHDAAFISVKSKDGKELKALELPGLWNGAMAFWNSVFVEVPLATFNPVKNVNDLLRDEHQE